MLMVDMAHIAGLVATGAHPSPVPYADFVTTTSHKTLRGPRSRLRPVQGGVGGQARQGGVPGSPGRAARARDRRQGRRVRRGDASRSSRPTSTRSSSTPRRWARRWSSAACGSISGGTDNHLLLVDLRPAGITGKDAEQLLEDVGITTNKNAIPNDPESPFVTSGIRVGSPAMTTRGFTEGEAHTVGLPHRTDRVQP